MECIDKTDMRLLSAFMFYRFDLGVNSVRFEETYCTRKCRVKWEVEERERAKKKKRTGKKRVALEVQ